MPECVIGRRSYAVAGLAGATVETPWRSGAPGTGAPGPVLRGPVPSGSSGDDQGDDVRVAARQARQHSDRVHRPAGAAARARVAKALAGGVPPDCPPGCRGIRALLPLRRPPQRRPAALCRALGQPPSATRRASHPPQRPAVLRHLPGQPPCATRRASDPPPRAGQPSSVARRSGQPPSATCRANRNRPVPDRRALRWRMRASWRSA
jgi:hypothetical protein